MTKIMRWGLLSTARINQTLIPPIRAARGSQLLAVASRDEARAKAYAAEWNIPRAYGSYEALLADPDIDILYNPLPNHLHAEWSLRAAQAGKHVLCEKPLGLSIQEVDQLIQAAIVYKVVIADAFIYRHHPLTDQVLQRVAGGAIGEVCHMYGIFTFRLDRPTDIRWLPEYGGGSLWDVGCYPVSYIRMVMGANPVEVSGWADLAPTGVDLSFSGNLRFASGATAQIYSSFGSPYSARIEIHGSRGSLVSDSPFRPAKKQPWLLVQDGKVEKVSSPMPMHALGEVEDVLCAARGERPQRLPLAESRDNIQTLSALYESARQGKKIGLS